ncbi:hypothetical protein [Actinacidiphila glaucinigra]|uniref:hypothetical protein n=1 Tax=Actinacidiphila glaucinigra TaxID=235986 RepID=UPI002E33DBF4|nr:hypothetical protein [Actinacidiphila glaucinigra]
MREPRRLDDLLAEPEVLIDRAGDEELAASRRRIEAEFAASRHTAGLAGGAPPPRPAQASLAAFLDRRARRGAAPTNRRPVTCENCGRW